ncbi:hypothetical protein IGI04_005433 [Brassica rapa subsp. trilocularis]|uniref:xyloglucan:xyloglucosyl transferase n=1 Tax=Brassica rapa subsp. trilocularis TaxID=1813537 RepID=A0ABQ7NE01_BRACM|nr:hypothetical protein IGI04_005433 [Brassica rapa subsp. trilocularis]
MRTRATSWRRFRKVALRSGTQRLRDVAPGDIIWSNGKSSCPDVSKQGTTGSWLSQELDSTAQERMRWVQRNYMIYNYCTDAKRFPQGLPKECLAAMDRSTFILSILLTRTATTTTFFSPVYAGTFDMEFDITWGDGRGKVLNNGELLTLSLDRASGSGFQSKKEYLFGKIDMQLKLVPGNSAGTVTAYYLKSKGDTWDEIDFEFLGNLTGDPYVMHTNVYTQGKGDREQQFNLWFDPTADFHTYSVLWNPHHIVFLVDGIAIRQFKNLEHRGIQYPKLQPMRLYSSLWNADQWATRGGLVKTDWSNAPFTASYRNFRADACVSFAGKSSCPASSPRWFTQKLDLTAEDKMRVVQSKFMVYNYCTDTKRFPQGVPKEKQLLKQQQQSEKMAGFETKLMLTLSLLLLIGVCTGSFYDNFDITWGDGRANIFESGQLLTCTLDKISGSGFQSKKEYLFGKIDMKMKLVAGNSAGTVTAYYLSSKGETWDEIDFEFLGNVTGQLYVLHTNVFTGGKGNREMQFYLWFDPTADFHTYTVLWNPLNIIFLVDGIPIRVFKNNEAHGVAYPKSQPMKIYSSLWEADDWATQGGRVKTDWSNAPFSAYYRSFSDVDCCSRTSIWNWVTCNANSNSWMWTTLNSNQMGQMKWVQDEYLIYNYCTDYKRFPLGLPTECNLA